MIAIPDAAWAIAILLAAPAVGSFIGLLTLRLPAGRPWAVTRSACDGCSRELGAPDLAPIVSFLALRGRCRSCGARIPRRYLALEIGCLAIAVWSVLGWSGGMAAATAILGWCLLAVAIVDGENLWLPDVLTWPLGLAGGLAVTLLGIAEPLEPVIGAAVGYGVLALVALVYRRLRGREGLGDGDPRLLAAIGAWVGWTGLPSVLLWACLVGLGWAAFNAGVRRRTFDPETPLPFGVYLAVGAWLTWLLGPVHASSTAVLN